MSASAVRAGRAFVEIYGDLASLKRDLSTVPAIVAGAAAAAGTSSSVVAAASQAMAARSAVAVGGVVASLAAAQSTTAAVGATTSLVATAAKAGWTGVTGSVVGMTAGIWAATKATQALGLQNTIVGRLLRTNSTLIGAGGLLAKIGGALTGSTRLQTLGTQLGRASIGMSIVRGLETGGWRGGLKAALWGGVQSGIVNTGLAGVSLTRRVIGGVFSGVMKIPGALAGGVVSGVSALQGGLSRVLPGMSATRTAADATSAAMERTGRVGGVVRAQLMGFGSGIASLAKVGVGGVVALSAVATKAALDFASKAKSIKNDAKEAGTSVGKMTDKVYGTTLAGTLISEQDINNGARLSESMSTLSGVVAVAWAQVGAAITPTLTGFFTGLTGIVQGGAIWLNQNRELVTTGFKVVSTVAQIAAGVGVLYGGLMVLGPVAALALNPFAVLTATVAAGIGYWAAYSEEGQSSLGIVSEAATAMGDIVNTTLGGIVSALSAGELELAAEIALNGVKAIFVEAMAAVEGIWANVVSSLANWLIDSGMFEAMNNVVTFIENSFTRIKEYVMGWVIWLQDTVGLIKSEEAKAKNEANKKSADDAVALRTQQATVENRMVRERPQAVKREIEDNRQRELDAIRARRDAERAAAREKLDASVQEATIAKKKQDQQLSAAAAQRATVPAAMRETTAAAAVQFGAAGANRQGVGGVWASMKKATEKTAENTGRIANTVETALTFG